MAEEEVSVEETIEDSKENVTSVDGMDIRPENVETVLIERIWRLKEKLP